MDQALRLVEILNKSPPYCKPKVSRCSVQHIEPRLNRDSPNAPVAVLCKQGSLQIMLLAGIPRALETAVLKHVGDARGIDACTEVADVRDNIEGPIAFCGRITTDSPSPNP